MEKAQDVYYGVISLVKKIQECEEKRRSLLSEINRLYKSGYGGNLGSLVVNMKNTLENLTVKVQEMKEKKKQGTESHTVPPETETAIGNVGISTEDIVNSGKIAIFFILR